MQPERPDPAAEAAEGHSGPITENHPLYGDWCDKHNEEMQDHTCDEPPQDVSRPAPGIHSPAEDRDAFTPATFEPWWKTGGLSDPMDHLRRNTTFSEEHLDNVQQRLYGIREFSDRLMAGDLPEPEVEGPRPPTNVAEAIRWIESLRDHRYAVRAPYRSGTGPAYRAEGEMNTFEMVLNLLYSGDPENPSRESSPT